LTNELIFRSKKEQNPNWEVFLKKNSAFLSSQTLPRYTTHISSPKFSSYAATTATTTTTMLTITKII
jgi:hypothetical protein